MTTLIGTLRDAQGSPIQGTITFVKSSPSVDNDIMVLTIPVRVVVNYYGQFSIQLVPDTYTCILPTQERITISVPDSNNIVNIATLL